MRSARRGLLRQRPCLLASRPACSWPGSRPPAPSPCSQLQSGARFPRRDLGQSWHPVPPRFPGRLCHAMVVTRGTAAGEWAADPIALCPHTGPGQLCAVEVPSQGEPSGGPEAQPASRHSPVPARRGRGGRCQLISQLAGFPPAAALRGGVAEGCLPGAAPGRPSAVHVGRRPWDAAAAPQGPCVLAAPGAGPGRPHPTAAPAVRPRTARPSCPGGRALAPAQAGARGAVSAGLAGGPVGVASRSRHGYVAPDALLSRALAGVLGGKPSRKTFLTRKRTSPEEMAVRAGGVGAGTVPGGAPPPRALLCPHF